MANTKKFIVKNGLYTQNIDFVSPDETNKITVEMLDEDTISVMGDSGQLFSITDSLTGTIFSVNDISGVPSIEVDDDGEIRLAETFGEVLIGTDVNNGTDKLQVDGDVFVSGTLNVGDGSQDSNILIKSSDASNADGIQFYFGTTRLGEIGSTDTSWLRINQITNKPIYTPRYIRSDSGFFVDDLNHGIDANGILLDASLSGTYTNAVTLNNASSVITASNKWSTARTITLGGDLTGDVSIDGSANVTLTATVSDDSHNHVISNVDNLQSTLDGKLNLTGGTLSGELTFSDDGEGITLNGGARVYKKVGTGLIFRRHSADIDPYVENYAGTSSWKIWHQGNDGTGSGMDADLLDGQQGSYYLDWTNVTNKPDPVITLGGDCSGSVTLTDLGSGTLTVTVADDSHNHVISNVDNLQSTLDGKASTAVATTSTNGLMSSTDKTKLDGIETGATADQTASEILTALLTVDGSGSTLDADTLDTLHASSFFRGDASNSVDVRLASGDGRGLRFWDSDSYKIWMSTSGNATYGGRITGETTSDYNIYFRITNGTNRGFVFENAYATKLFAINGDGVRSMVGIKSNTFRDTIQTLGSISTNTTLNTDNGNIITATIGAALEFTFSGTLTGNGITFMLKLTNGGAYTVTWPTSVKWPGGTAPALTASGTDVLLFNTSDGGTIWHGIANLDIK